MGRRTEDDEVSDGSCSITLLTASKGCVPLNCNVYREDTIDTTTAPHTHLGCGCGVGGGGLSSSSDDLRRPRVLNDRGTVTGPRQPHHGHTHGQRSPHLPSSSC